MSEYATSHSIIKALKGPTDPPTCAGLSKISIAQQAWKSDSVYFPNKDEVLVEWILSSFSRQKGKNLQDTTIYLSSYWSLLNDILSERSLQPGRPWLSALLSRISMANIVSLFFKDVPMEVLIKNTALAESFGKSLDLIWPTAVIRMNLDSLTDCFCSVLNCISSLPSLQQLPAPILDSCLLISRSFRQSIGTASNKKRAATAIGEDNLLQWIKVSTSSCAGLERRAESVLQAEIFQMGTDIIFSLEALKSPNDPIITTLHRGFTKSISLSQLSIIPRLYRAYLDESRRHRYTVFGSGSSQSQEQAVQSRIRDAGVKAFSVCCKTIREYGDDIEVWQGVLALLEVGDEAKVLGASFGTSDALSEIVPWAISALSVTADLPDHEGDSEKVDTAIRILRVLLRIDFELLGPLLRDVLTRLLMINPSAQTHCNALLREILEFFSKTRSIAVYITTLMETLSAPNLSSSFAGQHMDVQSIHRSSILGSLFSIGHLEDLGRAVRAFLTPGQAQECVNCVLEALREASAIQHPENTLMDLDRSPQPKPRKNEKQKQRKEETDNITTYFPMSFSLLARITAVILPHLPFHTLPPSICSGVMASVDTFGDEVLSKIMRRPFELLTAWRDQILLTATLRVRHSLAASTSLRSIRFCKERYVYGIFETETRRNMLPELVVEVFRTFFDWDFLGSDNDIQRDIIDAMIKYLADNLASAETFSAIGKNVMSWNGLSGTLDISEAGGHHRAALAIWHLALDRWLPLIDEIASPLQLRRLSDLIISLQASNICVPSAGSTATSNLEQVMRNAFFWELTNLRDAILTAAEEAMPVGSLDDFSKLANEIRGRSKKSRTQWEQHQIMKVASVFELLLHAPTEYLSKAQRASFFEKGLVADMAIYLSAKRSAGGNKQAFLRQRMLVRAWLGIVGNSVEIVELAHDWEFYMEFLLKNEYCEGDEGDTFRFASSALVESTMRETIRLALRGSGKQVQKLCQLLRELKDQETHGQELLQFIDILISEVPSNEKKAFAFTEAIDAIHEFLLARCLSKLPLSKEVQGSHFLSMRASEIRSWRGYLALHKWLGKANPTQQYGRSIVTSLVEISKREVKSQECIQLSAEVLLLLIDELHFVTANERGSHLEVLTAAYVLFGGMDYTVMSVCDAELGRVSRNLPQSDFSLLLGLLVDALRRSSNSGKETQCVIHLSQVLASNAPEGSSKVVQDHFEDCLQAFLGCNLLGCGEPESGLEVLKFIGNQCSERPASIRSLSIGMIWVILAKYSMGSTSHTPHTHGQVFVAIVDIVGALIRLRRDLVQTTLPHLVVVVRLLLSSLRSVRPQLGSKQSQLVSDTMPWWTSTSEPLGAEEARAVGRLFTSLQTKTIPRTFKEKDKTEAQRAESLAHPFSKHAPYVLLAYIEAMNHPLCVLPLAIRKELEPGLFALCDMMSEHGRDAIMVSALDAGGKATLKALWREYEKQRYVGKG